MSTVDDAAKAGARAIGAHHEYCVDTSDWIPYCSCGWKATSKHAVAEYDEHVSRMVLVSAWPVLSAGLRRLHEASTAADYAGDCMCGLHHPCPTTRELDRIDRALGIGEAGVDHDV